MAVVVPAHSSFSAPVLSFSSAGALGVVCAGTNRRGAAICDFVGAAVGPAVVPAE